MTTKKKIVIELNGNWILQHRNDDELPIEAIRNELLKDQTLQVKESTLTSLTIIYDEGNTNHSEIESDVISFFKTRYPKDDLKEVISFYSETYEEKETAGPKSSDNDYEDGTIVKESDKNEDDRARQSEGANGTGSVDEVDAKINALVGAKEFKKLSKEITAIAYEIKQTDTYEVFTNQCYIFSIGDGCGLTTYLKLLAELIEKNGLCRMASSPVREVRLAAYRESFEPFEEAASIIENVLEKSVRIVCIDISEWMDKTDNKYFKRFLRIIEKNAEENIVVFRVPFVDKDILSRIKYSLSDLLSVKAVSFPPLSKDDMKICAEKELKRYSFTISNAAWKYFFERISEEKSDGKFYGVNTIKKVVRELIYKKHIANAQRKKKSKLITVNDAMTLCNNIGDNKLSGMEQLNKLIGVDEIKKRIEEILAQIELALKSGMEQRPCIHMRFIGNPGTGKTTVARIIGKILKERGVLRIGAFFEYSGRDFCGRYVGETAPKTASICRDAYGSVLFIDEAYSLYRGDSDSRDFGREALDTLIAEMENHRNDFVVIMAGYQDDMEKLMSGNLGLASRMPYTIEFPNYTRDQLCDIFVSMVESKFKYEKNLFLVAREFFNTLPEETIRSKDFANARYARNLFERTWAKAALRCQLNGKKEIILTGEDFSHACADKEFATKITKKSRIGF